MLPSPCLRFALLGLAFSSVLGACSTTDADDVRPRSGCHAAPSPPPAPADSSAAPDSTTRATVAGSYRAALDLLVPGEE